ncbi:hypothetical protein AB0C76_03520 [Kitasatospora sp. NPDC048722]|uniref:hypothetical protein n=1 Tax=Kitasatospora sp. NPDC048722 TaxID=3155639 RepID=UPI003405FA5C
MADGALGRLRQLLREPVPWGSAQAELWAPPEAWLGLRLPTDDKAFLDLYGSGTVDE